MFETFYAPLEAWVDVRAYPSAQGLTVFCRDITARKQAEQALHESEQFLRSTLDSLSTHIAILDGRGIILAVNAAWKRFARENGCDEDSPVCGVGADYLGVTDAAQGPFSEEASIVAAGIRDILSGRTASFLLEYPCHEPGGEAALVPDAGHALRRTGPDARGGGPREHHGSPRGRGGAVVTGARGGRS